MAVPNPQEDPRECAISFLLRSAGMAGNLDQPQLLASKASSPAGLPHMQKDLRAQAGGQAAGAGASALTLSGIPLGE